MICNAFFKIQTVFPNDSDDSNSTYLFIIALDETVIIS